MSDIEFNKLWRRVAEDHAGIDADPNDLHNARVRTLLSEIKERMDRLTEPDLAAPPPGDGGLRELSQKAAEGGKAAAEELMTEFVSKQRAANWGIINDGLLACDALLRALDTRKEGKG